MPVLALVGVILSALRVAIEVANYLKTHPDTPSAIQEILGGIEDRITVIHKDIHESPLNSPAQRADNVQGGP